MEYFLASFPGLHQSHSQVFTSLIPRPSLALFPGLHQPRSQALLPVFRWTLQERVLGSFAPPVCLPNVAAAQHHLLDFLQYSGKLSKEKTFVNFKVCDYSQKWGRGILWQHNQFKQSTKCFSENHIFHQFTKFFSLESFPLCGIYILCGCIVCTYVSAKTDSNTLVLVPPSNLRRRKLLRISKFVTVCKSFLHKIWGCGILWRHNQPIHKSFLHENHIFHQFTKNFLPQKFPITQWLYFVCTYVSAETDSNTSCSTGSSADQLCQELA